MREKETKENHSFLIYNNNNPSFLADEQEKMMCTAESAVRISIKKHENLIILSYQEMENEILQEYMQHKNRQ